MVGLKRTDCFSWTKVPPLTLTLRPRNNGLISSHWSTNAANIWMRNAYLSNSLSSENSSLRHPDTLFILQTAHSRSLFQGVISPSSSRSWGTRADHVACVECIAGRWKSVQRSSCDGILMNGLAATLRSAHVIPWPLFCILLFPLTFLPTDSSE